jgi:N-acetylglucosaminyl-diphospho-decaprenol L-rhamnosyltransferase
MDSPGTTNQSSLVSVVVVNYNCKKWLDRFFPSLRAQTIFDRTEVIMVDNTSKDGSAEICEREMATWPNGVFVKTGGNYGFGGGSNRGAKIAHGKYLFFLNPDVWLEPNCLEELVRHAEDNGVKVAGPLVLDYDSDNVQVMGASGFDLFGGMISTRPGENCDRLFAIGTFYFIERELLQKLGGFDEELFLYNEETDLSWRAWIAGEPIMLAPSAHIHHQGASSGERAVENRTNETKRFYANRNQLLVIFKNAQCLLLVLALSQTMLIIVEAILGTFLARRFSFFHQALLKPMGDCWRLRRHVLEQRKQNHLIRRHGDWWILRHFFRFGFGRWTDVKRLFKLGVRIEKSWPTTASKNK